MKITNILLVEDDESFRSILAMILTGEGFVITEAENGLIAQDKLNKETFDLVITDIKMPKLSGLELLKWIKESKSTPVILMTGFSEILKTQEAYDLGADEFLPKPFEPEDVLGAIKNISTESNQIKNTDVDYLYCKVDIDQFITGREIAYNVYVRLSNIKYVKIANKGQDIPADRIPTLKSRGVDYLYLKKEDYKHYVGFTLDLAKTLNRSTTVSTEKKKKFLHQTGEIILEKLFVDGIDQHAFSQSKDYISTVSSLLYDSDDAINSLMRLYDHADFVYVHSLGVSMYAVMIANKLKWTAPRTLFKLAMGGLYHDVGKKEIDRSLLTKAKKDLSQSEVALLETHPIRGVDILGQLDGIESDIVQIVSQHHEAMTGYGFPMGLKGNNIHPLARVISVANVFCNVALPGPRHKAFTAPDAIKHMTDFHKDSLDITFFAALIRLFNLDPATYLGKDFDSDLKKVS